MQRSDFCNGWEFSRDGQSFQPVVVPHDAMLGARRDAAAPAGSASGYFHGGTYRYRKCFTLSEEQAPRHLLLEFEGVYRDARLAVNGQAVEAPPYGFIPFFADITGLVHAGENIVEVEADNSGQPDCRWYSGAGIHRPVWLWEGGDDRIAPEGVRVTTVSLSPAVVRVDVEHTGGTPLVRVLNADSEEVASGLGAHLELAITHANMWNADSPHLYRCEVDLVSDGGDEGAREKGGSPEHPILDHAEVRFGIRTLNWSRDGFFVNGRETLLRGGCIHCDNGILGAASFPESERRRIRLLKRAGFNAVRIAHNPAPAALLDACDELGMYVVDEAWDMWFTPKSAHDYARHFLDWCDFDLNRLASRDYNHPSVIMYSIGNEVADPLSSQAVALEESMVELLHSIDPTRPVTCELNLAMLVMERVGRGWYSNADGVAEAVGGTGAPRGSLLFNLAAQSTGKRMMMLANMPGVEKLVSPALDALDIAGYNYASTRYQTDARKHPDRIVVGSETFPYEIGRNWKLVRDIPNVIGDFQWAAWDYLGEAGAGSWAYTPEEAGFSKPWPWLIAGSGALDILGNPNAHAAIAAAVWDVTRAPAIMVRPVNRMKERTYKATWRSSDAIPSWSWRDCKGTTARVEVYSGNAHDIRLVLNGDTVAQQRVHDYVAKFAVAYHPGTLTAIALDEEGRELTRSSLVSAQTPLHLEAKPEQHRVQAGGIAYVCVDIVGANGQVESNADERLFASVEGGELLAFGSAQPAPTESFLDGAYTTYRGRSMAVVYRENPGTATLTVHGTTLGKSRADIAFF